MIKTKCGEKLDFIIPPSFSQRLFPFVHQLIKTIQDHIPTLRIMDQPSKIQTMDLKMWQPPPFFSSLCHTVLQEVRQSFPSHDKNESLQVEIKY